MAAETVHITFKLFASLSAHLPESARDHSAGLEVEAGATPNQILDRHGVPRKMAHLVLLNGVFVAPADRDTVALKAGDTLAVWPPVAGGCGGRAAS